MKKWWRRLLIAVASLTGLGCVTVGIACCQNNNVLNQKEKVRSGLIETNLYEKIKKANYSEISTLFSDYGQLFIDQFFINYKSYSNGFGWNISQTLPKSDGWYFVFNKNKIFVPTTLNLPLRYIFV